MTPETARPGNHLQRRWLLAYLVPEWKALCAGAAMMLARAGVLLLLPWPLKVIIDNVIFQRHLNPLLVGVLPDPVGRRMQLLNALGLGMLALGVVDALLVYFGNRLLLDAGQRIVAAIRFDLFAHLQRLSLDFHRRNHGGDLMERLGGDVRQIQDFIAAVGIDLLPHAITVVGMAGVMLFIDWRFAIVVISTGPLLMYIARHFSNRMRNALRQVRTQEATLAAKAQEVLKNVQVVQAFVREDYEDGRYLDEAGKCIDANRCANAIQAKFGPAINLTIAASTGLIAWFGAVSVIRGALSPGELLIFLAYLAAMAAPARQLAKTGRVFGRSVIALERIGECRAERATVADSAAVAAPNDCTGRVEIQNAGFGYQAGSPVLTDISFSMEPGTTVALVGKTGSGKSTIAGLIARFYDCGEGRILFDGRDSRCLPLSFLRRQIALVLQEPLLFHASVWENIAYGRHGAGYAQAVAAARAVGVDDILERLPAGFETVVSEGGKSLSGGQRQCISIARAMLSDAPVVILDEPSSSLDASTEHRLMLALRRLSSNRSALIIAHRLATIVHADQILVLDQGRIVERGHHAELLAAGKVYADLWRASQIIRINPNCGSSMNSHVMSRRTIILARHGQTRWNLEGRYQGRSDPALCRTGMVECAHLADKLSGSGVRSVFTSPLGRARQTAEFVADRLKIGVPKSDPRLAEIHFGDWEGHTQVQVRQRWPEMLRVWKTEPGAVRFPGGETLEEARVRLLSFFSDVARSGTPEAAPALVVTHAGLIRLAILAAQLQETTAFRRVDVAPASTWRFVLLMTGSDSVPVLDLTEPPTGAPPKTAG